MVAAIAASPADQRRQAIEHYKAGQDALYSERFQQAAEEFALAVKLDPLLTMAHYGLGQAHMALKEYPEAVRAYLGCRKAFEESEANRILHAAEWERRLEEQIQAVEERIQTLSSGHVQTGSSGGTTTGATIQRLEAQRDTLLGQRKRSMSQAEKTPPWISVALGGAYFRNNAMADAEREYKAALAVNPNIGEAHNNLAVVHLLTGRIDEAEQEVALAEKAGIAVPPGLKRDIERAKANPPKQK